MSGQTETLDLLVKLTGAGEATAGLTGMGDAVADAGDTATDSLDGISSSLGDLGDAASGAAGTAQDALGELADQLDSTQGSADGLGDSLGSGLGDQATTAGSNIGDLISQLLAAADQLDATQGSADNLGDSLGGIAGDVDLGGATDELGGVDDGLGDVEEGAGKAGTAIGAMAGKAIRELPGVGAALGPLAPMAGKLTAQLANGTQGLAAFGGAAVVLGGAALAMKGLSDASERQAKVDAWKKTQVEAWTKAVAEGGDQVSKLAQRLRDAGEIKVDLGLGHTADIGPMLDAIGVSVTQFSKVVVGGKDEMDQYEAALKAAGVTGGAYRAAIKAATDQQKMHDNAVAASAKTEGLFKLSQDDVNSALDTFIAKKDPVSQFPEAFQRIADSMAKGAKPAAADLQAVTDGLNISMDDALGIADGLAQKQADAAKATDDHAAADRRAKQATQDLADEQQRSKDLAEQQKDAWRDLNTALDNDDAILSLKDQFDQVNAAAVAAYTAGAAGSADAEQKARAHEEQVIALKKAVNAYGEEVGDLPISTVTEINALIDQGKLADAERQLSILARNRDAQISLDLKGATGTFTIVGSTARAGGGRTNPGEVTLQNENGPELAIHPDGTMIVPAGLSRELVGAMAGRGGGDTYITHQYFPPGITADRYADGRYDEARRRLS